MSERLGWSGDRFGLVRLQCGSATAAVARGAFAEFGQSELVLAKPDALEVWHDRPGSEPKSTVVLTEFPRLVACLTLPPASAGALDSLLVVDADFRWSILQLRPQDGRLAPTVLASGAIEYRDAASHTPRTSVLAEVEPPPAKRRAFRPRLVVLSLWNAVVTLLRIYTRADGKVKVVQSHMPCNFGDIPGPNHVLDVKFMEGPGSIDWNDLPMIAVVVATTEPGSGLRVVNVQPAAMNVETGRLQEGPWKVFNAHPTTALVGVPGGARGGVVTVHGHGAAYFDSTGKVAEVSWAHNPTCMHRIDSGRFLVGDRSGRVSLLALAADPSGELRLTMSVLAGATPAARACGFVPLSATSHYLLWSQTGPSQVVAVDLDARRLELTNPTLVDSMAPVVCAAAIDPYDTGRSLVVLGTGVHSDGCLRVGSYGAGIDVAVEGPETPGSPTLFSLKERPEDEFAAFVVFSFAAATRTQVMSVRSNEFEPATIAGFEEDVHTLSAFNLGRSLLLQATDTGINVIGPPPQRGRVHRWTPPSGRLDSVAHDASEVVAACGTWLGLLAPTAAGALQTTAEYTLPQQVSALCLAALSSEAAASVPASQPPPRQQQRFVFAGQWVTNAVVVFRIVESAAAGRSLQQLASCPMPAEAQVRAVLAFQQAKAGGPTVLVGTSDGSVLAFDFDCVGGAMRNVRRFCVGEGGVSLQPTEFGGHTQILASCGTVALFSFLDDGTLGCSGVQVTHAKYRETVAPSGVASICPSPSPTLSNGCALILGDRLVFGELSTAERLRWSCRHVGETTASLAYHSDHRMLVMHTVDASSTHRLRVCGVDTLGDETSTAFGPGHTLFGLTVAPLFPQSLDPTKYVVVSSVARDQTSAVERSLLSVFDIAVKKISYSTTRQYFLRLRGAVEVEGPSRKLVSLPDGLLAVSSDRGVHILEAYTASDASDGRASGASDFVRRSSFGRVPGTPAFPDALAPISLRQRAFFAAALPVVALGAQGDVLAAADVSGTVSLLKFDRIKSRLDLLAQSAHTATATARDVYDAPLGLCCTVLSDGDVAYGSASGLALFRRRPAANKTQGLDDLVPELACSPRTAGLIVGLFEAKMTTPESPLGATDRQSASGPIAVVSVTGEILLLGPVPSAVFGSVESADNLPLFEYRALLSAALVSIDLSASVAHERHRVGRDSPERAKGRLLLSKALL